MTDAEEPEELTRVAAALGDPSLTISSHEFLSQSMDCGVKVPLVLHFIVGGWGYPAPGRSIICHLDLAAGAVPPVEPACTTEELECTLPFPHGKHRICCVLQEEGELPGGCNAAACTSLYRTCLCDKSADPICADGNPFSADACMYSMQYSHRICTYGSVLVPENACLSTYDCPCGPDGWDPCIGLLCVPCGGDDANCADANLCTLDECTEEGCANTWIEFPKGRCCTPDMDPLEICSDGLPCTQDLCAEVDPETGLGHCESIPEPGACIFDTQCSDTDPCTTDHCYQCACLNEPSPDPLCCDPAEGPLPCDIGDPCVTFGCNPETAQCTYVAKGLVQQVAEGLRCCQSDDDCGLVGVWEEAPMDDPTTDDLCIWGQCQHLPKPCECQCDQEAACGKPCPEDGNPYTLGACDGCYCAHGPIPGFCIKNSDCWDGLVCTYDDTCSGNTCQHAAWDWCCDDALECDDGSPCTLDQCVNHGCHNGPHPLAAPGCCMSDADCLDLDPCTGSRCSGAPGICLPDPAFEPPPGCCLGVTDCDDGDPETVDLCLASLCAHVPACQNGAWCP
ncbi:MAG: hypothetical protein FJ098_10300 [Deltaproteobacteria bacterium]|nr:hypothetical protein [Deltaproteobacteria bacterium]